MIAQKTLDQVALTRAEYDLIVERLGRAPTSVEIGMFGALWSEHCGYKNSKPLLRLFPTQAPHVLQGPGENAGVVSIGGGLAVAMKVESHNHPSAIEPFQGAATGVGGIIRDIFTMGARPVALLDSLRFGPLDKARNRHLFEGVVAGISAYGNCLGVPTVGGEVEFADTYSGNPLVNVMAVGLLEEGHLMRAEASEPGNVLMLVGADTGRDGIHGATFASVELNEASEERRPAVQVGNPFLEKLLIEACLEVIGAGCAVGMQDLGAAGLTSSVVETAAKGNWGAEIDVAKVSRRERGMTPYEVMLSESQERMLVVLRPEQVNEARAIFDRWALHSDVIGSITADGLIRVTDDGHEVAKVPATLLTDPPIYRRIGVRPAYLDALARLDGPKWTEVDDLGKALLQVLSAPSIASKEHVFRQYDHMVQTNTVLAPGAADAAVLRVKGTAKAIAVTIDCDARLCYLDPYKGGIGAVAEAARNLVCVGARPLALTDCLNFGNPEKPEIFYQLEQAVLGIVEACRELSLPVIGGNVSLYNETMGQAVYPTPVVGMIGLIDNVERRCQMAFQSPGDIVFMLGDGGDAGLGGSEYLATVCGIVGGVLPAPDLRRERAVQECCLALVQRGLVKSAHDCSGGGLAVTLAESAITGNIGASVVLPDKASSPDNVLFNEAHSRIVISLAPEDCDAVERSCAQYGVPLRRLGSVGGRSLRVDGLLDVPLAVLAEAWRGAIERQLQGPKT